MNDTTIHRRDFLYAMALSSLPPILTAGCGRPPGPITKVPDWVALEHPETEEDLIRLVNLARSRGAQLRVRGSMHSNGRAIFTDERDGNINVHLDRYNRILGWNESRREVTVQAGIHLGLDPMDPATTWDNSLNIQLQKRGWALPTLGGITHQTVGGFLSTGSAGGTLHHDLGSAIVSIRLVAGDGKVYELERNPDKPGDEDENPFYAAGVAMGLFGVLSTVTIRCVPSYNVEGRVITVGTDSSKAPAQVYGEGPRGLQHWFETNEYNRTLIWPQEGVDKVEFWSARRLARSTGFRPKPYVQLEPLLQKIASAIYEHVDEQAPPYDKARYGKMRFAIRQFVTDDDIAFRDYWYRGLPTDNGISDEWMPTEFTDLFVDVDRTHELMLALRRHWRGDTRMDRTGPYATEVYATNSSQFWMHPAFRRKSVRVDFLWFKSGHTNPATDFYPQYWDLLAPFGFRFHWGKHLSPGDGATGVAYRRSQQGVHWDKWMQLRAMFDPKQVFVTDYWREHLGITRG